MNLEMFVRFAIKRKLKNLGEIFGDDKLDKFQIIKQHPDRPKNLSGLIFAFCISNFRAIGQSRTPVPTMGMRVAEDVAPYKEEYNFLMRSTRFSGVFLFKACFISKGFSGSFPPPFRHG